MVAITNSQTEDQWLCWYLYFFTGGNAPLQHDDQNLSLDHSGSEIDPPLDHSGGEIDHSGGEIDPPLDCSGGEIDPPLDHSGGEIDPPLDCSGGEIDYPLNCSADKVDPSINHSVDSLLNHPADDAPLLNCSADHSANVDLPIEIKKRNEAAQKLHASIRTKAHNRKKKAEKKV